MSGAGNDFIIVDARANSKNPKLELTKEQIAHLSNREVIGCDQFVVIKASGGDDCDCFMGIYNKDGSEAEACGNATRCVASLIMAEKNQDQVVIETKVDKLHCFKSENEISVKMTKPKFGTDFYYDDKRFFTVNVGNPHAVCFDEFIVDDEYFQKIGKEIESHPFFPDKTNVEFVRIVNDNMVEVRVFERGVGETLACGTGACAVAAVAIKYRLTPSNKIITRFRGGDLTIEWDGDENSQIIMTGGFKEEFDGEIEV